MANIDEELKATAKEAEQAANLPFNGVDPKTGATGDDVLRSLGFEPTPNPLWAFDQANYHFRFYLQNDLNPNDDTSITIAETGITGMNIQEVRMETYVAPNIKTRNTMATSVTIKIFEPHGAKLPDRMIFAATELRLKNYYKAPWKLDLKFQGYEDNGFGRELEELGVWTWQLMLINITTQVTEGGSYHSIEAVPFAETALANQFSMIPNSATPKGETVGEVLTDLVNILNNDQKDRYGVPLTEYAIEDRPYKGENLSGIPSPFMHRITSAKPQQDDERNAEGGSYAPGTDIPSIIENVLSASDTVSQQMVSSRSIDPKADQKEVKSVVSLVHRVETKVELVGFDQIVGDYRRKVTFVVVPYDTMRLLTNVTSAENYEGTPEVQQRKMDHAKKRFFLQKQYDYLYTGQNVDIEKFDINLNFRWQVSVPQLFGMVHYGTSTTPREHNPKEEIKRLQGLQGELDSENAKLTALEAKKGETPPADPDEAAARAAEIDQEITTVTARRNRLRDDLAAGKLKQDSESPKSPVPKPKSNYAEDLISLAEGFRPPITLSQDGDSPLAETNWGTSAHSNAGKSVYGTLLNQLYGTFDANLMQIELTIRGDPYWLGPDRETLSIYKEFPESSSNYASYSNGEHMFAFRFKLPQGVDKDTGTVRLATDETFTGFYAAYQITHVFSEGQFKQVIQANRIPSMKVAEHARESQGGET